MLAGTEQDPACLLPGFAQRIFVSLAEKVEIRRGVQILVVLLFSSFLLSLLEGAGQLEFVVCREETEILLTAEHS